MQKCQILKFVFDPPGPTSLGVPQLLGETSNKKITQNKEFLEFYFKELYFMPPKNSLGTHQFRPQYFRPYPKILNSAPFLLALVRRFPKRYVAPLQDKNSGRRQSFQKQAIFGPGPYLGGKLICDPCQKYYLYRVGLVLKISVRSFHSIKLFKLFNLHRHRQRDAYTDG